MRKAQVKRETKETQITMELSLDGSGCFSGSSQNGFFDHMLTLLCHHSGFDLSLNAKGDTWIDNHHIIEDIGIVLGQCFLQAIGDKRGIARYGDFVCPMDEALTAVHLDLSGRGYLVYNLQLTRENVGDFECEMLKEFLYAFAMNAKITLHVNNFYGENNHHMIESVFKALGRALKMATIVSGDKLPSSKGVL